METRHNDQSLHSKPERTGRSNSYTINDILGLVTETESINGQSCDQNTYQEAVEGNLLKTVTLFSREAYSFYAITVHFQSRQVLKRTSSSSFSENYRLRFISIFSTIS